MYSVFQSLLRSAGSHPGPAGAGETDCGQCEADLPCLQLYRQEGGREGRREGGRTEGGREGGRKKPSFPPYELLLALVIAGPAGAGETDCGQCEANLPCLQLYRRTEGQKEGRKEGSL